MKELISLQLVTALIGLTAVGNGCATSNRTKTIALTAAAGTAAYFIAQAATPSGTDPAMHGVFWSGLTMAGTALGGQFIFDEQKKSEELERQIRVLRQEIEVYRSDDNPTSGAVLSEGAAGFEKDLPKELRGLYRPGKWIRKRWPNRKKNWVRRDENSIYRISEELTFTPPQFVLNPSLIDTSSSGEVTDVIEMGPNQTPGFLTEIEFKNDDRMNEGSGEKTFPPLPKNEEKR